jgi:predicted RNA-binding protein with TRAM domain
LTAETLTLTLGAPANGGSCVARHDGRVVFVRYALPGETVTARITSERGSYWHAEAVEILEPSADRIASLCPIAGPHGAGCCDLAFAEPTAARRIKGEVVGNQLSRLARFDWLGAVRRGSAEWTGAERVAAEPRGSRDRPQNPRAVRRGSAEWTGAERVAAEPRGSRDRPQNLWARACRPAGAPGCGWPSAPTGGPASTATTAPNW